jgi:hypothetical protein
LAAALALVLAAVLSGPVLARTPVLTTFPQLPAGPWLVNQPAEATGGALTLGAYGYAMLREQPANDWYGTVDNNRGWTVDARARLDPSVTTGCADEPARLWAGDHTTVVIVALARGEVCLTYPETVRVPFDTQSAFHTYRLDVRRDHVRLRIDGRLVIDHHLRWAGGGTVALAAESLQGVSHWQYLRYDTTPSLPSCTITGTPGDDTLVGGPGRDVLCGGDGADRLIGGGGRDVLIGGLGDDVLHGGDGDDTLLGGWGDDRLDGGAGDDSADGGSGRDRLVAAARPDGGDRFSGGQGQDVADYAARGPWTPVTVTIDDAAGDGAAGEDDRIGAHAWDPAQTRADVEGIQGGAGADLLTGDGSDNELIGGPGADTLRGLGGTDVLRADDGAPGDTADGGAGTDRCLLDPGDVLVSCNEPPCPSGNPSYPMPPPPGGTPGTPSPCPSAPYPTLPSSPAPTSAAPTSAAPTAPPTPPAPGTRAGGAAGLLRR